MLKENTKPLSFLSTVLFLQAASYIIVFFDIPVIRQILLFAYLTFVPGYLIVKLFRFNFNHFETLIFSVGFSVAFLMLTGLALNELGYIAGISQPLSTFPLLIMLNNAILALVLLTYWRNEASSLTNISFSLAKWIAPLLVPLILSVVGAMFVGVYGNNLLLLLMILAISLVAAFLTLKAVVPSTVYVFAVFIIGVSLLLHSLLVSRYITTFGSDVSLELFVFRNTLESGYWNSVPPAHWDVGLGRLNGMLSITILPTVYSNILGLDSTWVFKLVFPLIFAFAPLCLYQIWRKSFGAKWAFVSAFFFMATAPFYTELLGLNRQMVAELFFTLLLFILLDKRLSGLQRIVSFTFFGFGLVVSHYGLAEIFLFLIVFALVCLLVSRQRSNNLTVSMVVLFFVIMFAWYIYTSRASVFESFLDYGEHVYQRLGEFFNLESRGKTVLRGLGLESPPTIWNAISRFFVYATEFLIIVGFASLFFRRNNMINLRKENFILISWAMGFLAALIIVPGLANTMNMTRFYHVLLSLLAPLCTLGATFITEIICRRKGKKIYASVLLVFILMPYFLFQSGFVYEITNSQSWSLPLSMHRLGIRLHASFGVVTSQEVHSSLWLSQYFYAERSSLFADFHIFSALVGYGKIVSIMKLTNTTKPMEGSYIYFGKLNTVYGMVFAQDVWNSTDILKSNFEYSDNFYSNGECEIFWVISLHKSYP
ncbi:DUF2206 domain-containing protein [Candidatus Bathyarchaeota archaeon]|nr:DUF2206 domain-containing protein [Candidatus Bathyarchaeota archaeon]